MSENDKNKELSSEELNNLLDDYIASIESRAGADKKPAPLEPELPESPALPDDLLLPEVTGEKPARPETDEPEAPLTLHFTNVSALDSIGRTQELNIDNHLSDEAPSELAEFNREGAEAPAVEGDAGEQPAQKSEDEPEVPWYKRAVKKVGSFIWNSGFLLKAGVYILIVLAISAFLSYYIIAVGNDVMAFVKSDREVTVTIPENITRKELSFLLEKNGIISYDWAFNLFLIYKGCDESSFLTGEHTFNAKMNYSQIISELTEVKRNLEEVSITIPEGYTVDQIIDLLTSQGIGTREKYIEAINEYPYQHEFVKELEKLGYSSDRVYRLEGYLYPDTYYFYKDSAEYLVINKMLNNFNNKFWIYYESTFKEEIEKTGLTFDEIITLASMIQSEAKLEIDFEYISYVFRNRLSHPSTFPRLESDATVQYALMLHGETRNEDLTSEQLAIDDPYNTRLYEGLPPGAICNPGFDAISAAIYPDMPMRDDDTAINAYFFVSNKAGKTYYAETLSEHNENVRQVKKDNDANEKE
jgi:UPF0755 protein